ncbi:hypothetical protein ZIOFF_016327 [Zingiber officinale]|uniref:RRM domain-containing protein n=1 Tax=Zingiber officinale TaxID=94328 RepID=A0A8J5HSK8_ZINOF|nr:hypothetical protein ZIOFF_016327 [Zingiber officinale]
MESWFDEEDTLRLTRTYDLPADHQIVLATPADRPHEPPPGTVLFFRDQFLAGLPEVIWRAKATEKLKLKAAQIEAVKNKEVAERGLDPADLTGELGEGTQDAPEALAATTSPDEAAGGTEPSTQVEVEGRSADDVPLVTRKRRRPESASASTPLDEPQPERGADAPVLSGTISLEILILERASKQIESFPSPGLPRPWNHRRSGIRSEAEGIRGRIVIAVPFWRVPPRYHHPVPTSLICPRSVYDALGAEMEEEEAGRGNILDPAAAEFYPAAPAAAGQYALGHPQIYYAYPPAAAHPPPPPPTQVVALPVFHLPQPQQMEAAAATTTRAVALSMVPRHVGEGEVRAAMEAFGGVRAVEMGALAAEGVVTVYFFDFRSAEAVVAEVREQHARLTNAAGFGFGAPLSGNWSAPWSWRSPELGRGTVAGHPVWAQFAADDPHQGCLVLLNSDPTVSLLSLREIFEPFGLVKEVREMPSKPQHKLVEFFDTRDAARALSGLNGKEFNGRRLLLEFSRHGGRSSNNPRSSGQGHGVHNSHLLPSSGGGRRNWKSRNKISGESRFLFKEAAEPEDSSESSLRDSRTTVMIKNIPNKYSQKLLLNVLDSHCIQCNKQIIEEGEQEQPYSAYDFVYLPIDFNNKCNVGYGFVNLTSPEAAFRLYKGFHLQPWEAFNSRKICQVTYARLQGVEALKEHFKNTKFACDNEEYMPVIFSPPRDGKQLTEPVPVVVSRPPPPPARGGAPAGAEAAEEECGGASSTATTSPRAASDEHDDDDDDVDVDDGGGGDRSSSCGDATGVEALQLSCN